MRIQLIELNKDNWLEAANLSVSEQQKAFFPIPNVYWLGISRYEEHTTLYAVMLGEIMIGLIGLGYDEDGILCYIWFKYLNEGDVEHGYFRGYEITAQRQTIFESED